MLASSELPPKADFERRRPRQGRADCAPSNAGARPRSHPVTGRKGSAALNRGVGVSHCPESGGGTRGASRVRIYGECSAREVRCGDRTSTNLTGVAVTRSQCRLRQGRHTDCSNYAYHSDASKHIAHSNSINCGIPDENQAIMTKIDGSSTYGRDDRRIQSDVQPTNCRSHSQEGKCPLIWEDLRFLKALTMPYGRQSHRAEYPHTPRKSSWLVMVAGSWFTSAPGCSLISRKTCLTRVDRALAQSPDQ
jgi:hypothetical protein